MGAGNKALKGVLAFLTLLVAVIILGVSIATMIKVYQKPKAPDANADSKGLPDKPNLMNVQPPVQISEQVDANKFSAYQAYAKVLADSINTTFDPCDDFFMYTCGSFKGNMSFGEVQAGNMKHVANGAKKDQKSKAGKQAAYHFKKCVEAYKNPKIIHADGQTIVNIYNDFQSKTGLYFPLFTPGWTGDFPTREVFAKAVGVLSGYFGTDTFVSFMIDTNWRHPADAGQRPYAVYVDQTTLTFPDTYYTKAWDVFKDSYANKSESVLNDVAGFLKVDLDADQLNKDLQAIFDMEVAIAKDINTDGNTRRDYSRMANPYNIADANAKWGLIKFDDYLNQAMAFGSQEARDVVTNDPNYQIFINEPDQLDRLTAFLHNKVDARTVYNYFFFRLLLGKSGFLPSAYTTAADSWVREDYGHLGKKANDRWKRIPRPHPDEVADDDSAVENICAEESANFLWYINARWFLDDLLPSDDQRDKLRSSVALITAKVLEGFQNQLDQLSWMTSDTKKGAYDKITYLTRNMGYPSQIIDDRWLDDYYTALTIDTNSDYLDVLNACNQFVNYDQMQRLTLVDQTIRDDFGGCPSIVNAWYQPEMNSITFPLGILQRPFFDVNYPSAINYGAFGVVAGHELTHGFDDQGVQWNGVGRLSNWMDQISQVGFKQMTDCVVNQYGQYSPTPGFTVDGTQTLGENVADNGGIRAAFNAFQAHQDFYGPDPRLPDDKLDSFTPEQLFFLAFARIWCEINPDVGRLQKQVLVDPHSPSQFRVLGTIQNFAAFRSAFNCREGSKYAPSNDNRCDVWASEVQVVTGIPPTPPPTKGKQKKVQEEEEKKEKRQPHHRDLSSGGRVAAAIPNIDVTF